MTSNQHGPYALGYTRVTMAGNNGKRSGNTEQIPQTQSQFGLRAATCPHEVGIASKRKSATLR